jgi:hypothetical protein
MDPQQEWLVPGCSHTLELPQTKYQREKKLALDAAAAEFLLAALAANELQYPADPWVDFAGDALVLDVMSLDEMLDCLVVPDRDKADEWIAVILWRGQPDAEGYRPFYVLDYLPRVPDAFAQMHSESGRPGPARFSRSDHKRFAALQMIAEKYDGLSRP